MTPAKKIRENSEITDKEAILILLTGMSFADGDFHKEEKKFLEDYCKKEGVKTSFLKETITKFKKAADPEKLTTDCLDLIRTTATQSKAIKYLESLSECDNALHPSETDLLEHIRKKWGISIDRTAIKLDKKQKEIAESDPKAHIIVNAGPGTGKTAVLSARIGFLLNQGIQANDIWAMSFTRSAVKEMKDRIEYFSSKANQSRMINISTIDSRAFSLRYGFTLEDTKTLFRGGYEKTIDEANKLLDDEDEIRDYFRHYKHFVIDEAQDLYGERANFILKILKLLPKECGKTIFLDPAQSIFGFTDDSGNTSTGSETFDTLIDNNFKDQYETKELQVIYRTDSPKLKKLVEDYRLDLFMEPFTVEKLENWRQRLPSYAGKNLDTFKSDIEDNLDQIKEKKPLILFRVRTDVLRSSILALEKGLQHKLRLGGLPACVRPEYGVIFYDEKRPKISEKEFNKIIDDKKDIIEANWPSFERKQIWQYCIEGTGSADNILDMEKLKDLLARSHPPDEFLMTDLSDKGPILGTIHASKGREADDVHLYAPEDFRYTEKDQEKPEKQKEIAEEARVLYVGASRSRKNLRIGKGYFRSWNNHRLESGRAYIRWKDTRYGQKCASVELGIARDLEDESFANEQSQNFLRTFCITDWPIRVKLRSEAEIGWSYRITPDIKELFPLGHFSKYSNGEIGEISKKLNKGTWLKPRTEIDGQVFITGARTVAIGTNPSPLVKAPYKDSGIWLAPIIRGFASFTFSTYGKKRKWS